MVIHELTDTTMTLIKAPGESVNLLEYRNFVDVRVYPWGKIRTDFLWIPSADEVLWSSDVLVLYYKERLPFIYKIGQPVIVKFGDLFLFPELEIIDEVKAINKEDTKEAMALLEYYGRR